MSSLTNALFLVSIYGKWFPWEFTDGHMHWGGGDTFGSISINLKKIFNFTIEKHKQDCNMNAFYLKQGQN